MPSSFEFELSGADAMQRTLGRLGRAVSEPILTSSLKRGTAVLTAEARANLEGRPYATGELARAIGTRVKFYQHSQTAVAIWGVRRGKQYRDRANIVHLLEFGHRAFFMGRDLQRRTPPYPFLTPAWESKHREAMRVAHGHLGISVRAAAAMMGVRAE